jgi:GSH-dependent disulfide-bond oxidoreductase
MFLGKLNTFLVDCRRGLAINFQSPTRRIGIMIDIYVGPTGNAHRATIALAESGLPYRVHKLDLSKGEHRQPEFLAVAPAGRIPAMVDHAGPGGKKLHLSQSAAILIYVANKVGKLWPKSDIAKIKALEWVMQAATDAAPASGALFQSQHFVPEKVPANIAFFEGRIGNFLKEAEQQLAGQDYLAGTYSVADIALFPVVNTRKSIAEQLQLPHLLAWHARVGARKAVQRGLADCAP